MISMGCFDRVRTTLVAFALTLSASNALPAPLAYDPSAYETAEQFQPGLHPWTRAQLKHALSDRIVAEKQRHEINTCYYRIGHTLAFPLPVAHRPQVQDLPAGISGMTYPWLIWLTWDLEERWRMLHFAWRQHGDRQAGALLQRELAALSGWDHFYETRNEVGLVTAHLAGALSLALTNTSQWQPEHLHQTRIAATNLIERDVWPWFQTYWTNTPLTPNRIHNIPVIALVRSAQLARVINSPRADALDEKAHEVIRTWWNLRLTQFHSEGSAYDGFLMDSATDWLEGLPDRSAMLAEGKPAFRSLADQWIGLMLPGRPDLQAPLGDTEPEMAFWATALTRMTGWYDWPEVNWLLQRTQLSRLRSNALILAWQQKLALKKVAAPKAQLHEHPYAITLRTGWDSTNLLAAIGLNRNTMGHLHFDTGHLVLAWQNRCWIVDPGYQQYRKGEERDYTLGPQAHNSPVINGAIQTKHAGQLLSLETNAAGWQHAKLDLSRCYKGLPKKSVVKRDLWLLPNRGVVLRDEFKSLGQNAAISLSWHGGTHLAWSFQQGWARLSDGRRCLWIAHSSGPLPASALTRHPGSRGPLTLTKTVTLPTGNGCCWWVFYADETGGWEPPTLQAEASVLELISPPGTSDRWLIQP